MILIETSLKMHSDTVFLQLSEMYISLKNQYDLFQSFVNERRFLLHNRDNFSKDKTW